MKKDSVTDLCTLSGHIGEINNGEKSILLLHIDLADFITDDILLRYDSQITVDSNSWMDRKTFFHMIAEDMANKIEDVKL